MLKWIGQKIVKKCLYVKLVLFDLPKTRVGWARKTKK